MGPTAVLMFLALLLLGQQLSPCDSLRVAAFNMKRFAGDTTLKKEEEDKILYKKYVTQLVKVRMHG